MSHLRSPPSHFLQCRLPPFAEEKYVLKESSVGPQQSGLVYTFLRLAVAGIKPGERTVQLQLQVACLGHVQKFFVVEGLLRSILVY